MEDSAVQQVEESVSNTASDDVGIDVSTSSLRIDSNTASDNVGIDKSTISLKIHNAIVRRFNRGARSIHVLAMTGLEAAEDSIQTLKELDY